MKFEWKKVESTTSPDLIDTASAPGKTYVRKNVSTYQTADKITMYKYEELLLTPEEYAEYVSLQDEVESPSMQMVAQNFEELSLSSLERNVQSQAEREAIGQQISNLELMILSGSDTGSTTTTTS